MGAIQKRIFNIDGVRLVLKPRDLDGDGVVGGIETVPRFVDDDSKDIVQPSDMGESLKYLNEDLLDRDDLTSGIDLRSNLSIFEIPAIFVIDSLVRMRFLPISFLSVTRQKKRLNVSVKGVGREQIVNIFRGDREHEEKKGAGGIQQMGGGIKT